MAETFDAYRYARYMALRWHIVAGACVVAAMLAFGGSLLLPKRYTATARVLINPPHSPNGSTVLVVSPVYLESLETYEHFALSDSLFAEAAEELELRSNPDQSLRSLKKSSLKVERPRNTRIMEIHATVGEPKRARALANFIAERTVAMSHRTRQAGDDSDTAKLAALRDEAKVLLDEKEAEMTRLSRNAPTGGLDEELDAAIEARLLVEQDKLTTEAEIASLGSTTGAVKEALLARAKKTGDQLASLDARISNLRARLGMRQTDTSRVEAQTAAARVALESAERRLAEARARVGNSGERLEILDPGVVPEAPSSPNKLLNTVAAAALGLIFSVLYLSLAFGLGESRAESRRRDLRVAGNG